jgi:hypothetical protein
MTVYQIDVPDELWAEWKATVSRDRTLNDRIVTLIEEDANNAN